MTGFFSFNASCFQREDPALAGDCSGTESRCLHMDLPNRPAPNACASSTACRLQTFRQETKANELGPVVLVRGLKNLEGLANGADYRYASNGTSLEEKEIRGVLEERIRNPVRPTAHTQPAH
jgi:hypothetical protein